MNNPGQQPSPNAEVNAFVNAVNGFSEAGAERYAGMNVADASSYNDTFRRENLSRMSNLAVDSMPNGSSWVDANGQWHVVVTGISVRKNGCTYVGYLAPLNRRA
jgi:hypothetical protein